MKIFQNDRLIEAVRKAGNILLCTHVSPDGDAIGSTLALGLMLESMGKKVTVSCADPVPSRMHFLSDWEWFCRPEDLEGMKFDTAIAVDAADAGRMGGCQRYYMKAPVRLQIDHHGTNPLYAQENEVDEHAAAAGCIVWRFAQKAGIKLTKEMSECLYTAISSDTGNFCFENTDDECFDITADLVRHGLSINDTARPLHLLREIPHVKLLAKALESLYFIGDGKIACMCLRKHHYLECDAGHEHADKIVNYAIDLPGVEMCFLADETDRGAKFSLRAQPPRDVACVASRFGGGGHVLAAGCRMSDTPFDTAVSEMEEALLEQLQ